MKKVISIVSFVLIALALGSCCNKSCKAPEPVVSKTIKIVIAASVEIKPDKVEQFKQFAEGLVAASRSEAGCISYTMYENTTEKNKFFFFEEWKDQAAIDAHLATPHFQAFGKLMEEAGAASATIKTFEVSAEK